MMNQQHGWSPHCVPGTTAGILPALFNYFPQIGSVMRNQSQRVKWSPKLCSWKWRSENLNPGGLAPEAKLYISVQEQLCSWDRGNTNFYTHAGWGWGGNPHQTPPGSVHLASSAAQEPCQKGLPFSHQREGARRMERVTMLPGSKTLTPSSCFLG